LSICSLGLTCVMICFVLVLMLCPLFMLLSWSDLWSWRHLYRPWDSAVLHYDITWRYYPTFPQSGQLAMGSSDNFHGLRFVGDGCRSYTDLRRKLNWSGSYLHSSCQVSFFSGKFYFIQFPCLPSWTDLEDRVSSSALLSSVCTIDLLSTLSESLHRCLYLVPSLSLPLFVVPTISWSFKLLSACSTACFTDHFHPFFTPMPAPLIFPSDESFSVSSRRALATVYSSTSQLNGICSFDDRLYKPRHSSNSFTIIVLSVHIVHIFVQTISHFLLKI
jgi:hypothetical protein